MLTGCGSSRATLDAHRVDGAVAYQILRTAHAPALVRCPGGLPTRAGYSFTCSASFEVGTAFVRVTETNDAGKLAFRSERPLARLNIARVELAIRASLDARHGGPKATVTCPAYVLEQAGLAFTCSAVLARPVRTVVVSVTELDGRGDFRIASS